MFIAVRFETDAEVKRREQGSLVPPEAKLTVGRFVRPCSVKVCGDGLEHRPTERIE